MIVCGHTRLRALASLLSFREPASLLAFPLNIERVQISLRNKIFQKNIIALTIYASALKTPAPANLQTCRLRGSYHPDLDSRLFHAEPQSRRDKHARIPAPANLLTSPHPSPSPTVDREGANFTSELNFIKQYNCIPY